MSTMAHQNMVSIFQFWSQSTECINLLTYFKRYILLGVAYYFDKISGVSIWNKPDDFVEEEEEDGDEMFDETFSVSIGKSNTDSET